MKKLHSKLAIGFITLTLAFGASMFCVNKAPLETKASMYGKSFALSELSLSGSYDNSASDYVRVPATAANIGTITMPLEYSYTVTSNISVAFQWATYGSGSNPTSSNTTLSTSLSASDWTISQPNAYPTSSTYVSTSVTYTLKQSSASISQVPLSFYVSSGTKVLRIKSLQVSFSYSGTTDPNPEPEDPETPAETDYQTVLNIHGSSTDGNAPWSTSYGSSSGYVTAGNGSYVNISYTNVGYMSKGIQIKANASNGFYSTSTLKSYIKSIIVTTESSNFPLLYASTSTSNWGAAVSFASGQPVEFDPTAGIKYFKVTATSGYARLSSIEIVYRDFETISAITSVSGNPKAAYGDTTWDFSDLTVLGTLNNVENSNINSYVNIVSSTQVPTEMVSELNVSLTISKKNGYNGSPEPLVTVVTGTMFERELSAKLTIGNNGFKDETETTSYQWKDNYRLTNIYLNGVKFSASASSNAANNNNDNGKYSVGSGILLKAADTYNVNGRFSVDVGANFEITSLKFVFNSYNEPTLLNSNGDQVVSNAEYVPSGSVSIEFVHLDIAKLNSYIRLYEVTVTYKYRPATEAVRAFAEFMPTKGQYYNAAKYQDSTSTITNHQCCVALEDIWVTTYDENDRVVNRFVFGEGFTASFGTYTLNGVTSKNPVFYFTSYTNFNPGAYPVSIIIVGGGKEGMDVTNNDQINKPNIVVIHKTTTSTTWTHEQTSSFISMVDPITIDGRFICEYNDGQNFIPADYSITTNIYLGDEPIENNLVVHKTVKKSVHKEGYTILPSDIIEGKELPIDENGILQFKCEAQLYIEMFDTKYGEQKLGKVVDISLPDMTAEDANDTLYLIGSTYNMNASGYIHNGSTVIENIPSDEIILNPSTVTFVNSDPVTITATWENTGFSTTYQVSAREEPVLSDLCLFDESGASLTASNNIACFTAGDEFRLYNKAGENYFAEAIDEDVEIYEINKYDGFTFELFDGYDTAVIQEVDVPDDEENPTSTHKELVYNHGQEIHVGDYLRLSMDEKYVRAVFSFRNNYVFYIYQLAIGEKTICNYSNVFTYGHYEKLTTECEDYCGEYLLVYTGYSSPRIFAGSFDPESSGLHFGSTITGSYYGNAISSASETFNNERLIISEAPGDGYYIRTVSGYYLGLDDTFVIHSLTPSEDFINHIVKVGNSLAIQGHNNMYFYYNGGSFVSDDSPSSYIALFKKSITSDNGDPVQYLMDIIDAYRLNNDVIGSSGELSICPADTSIYDSDYWKGTNGKVSAREVFNNLHRNEIARLNVQDKYGAAGNTYIDTYNMLFENDPNKDPKDSLFNLSNQTTEAFPFIFALSISTISVLTLVIIKSKKTRFSK